MTAEERVLLFRYLKKEEKGKIIPRPIKRRSIVTKYKSKHDRVMSSTKYKVYIIH